MPCNGTYKSLTTMGSETGPNNRDIIIFAFHLAWGIEYVPTT